MEPCYIILLPFCETFSVSVTSSELSTVPVCSLGLQVS